MRALTHTEEDTLYAKALKELKYGDPTVSKEERHKLYRKLCKEFHPDLNPEMLKKDPNSEIIKQINIAYEDIKKGTVRHIEQVRETPKQPKRRANTSKAKTGQYRNPNWQQEYRDPIDMNVLYQELDKVCKKVETLRAAKKQANRYIAQVGEEVASIDRQVALSEVRRVTNQNEYQRLSLPVMYRWCADLYSLVHPVRGSKKDKLIQVGLGIAAGLETVLLGAAYVVIVPYPVLVFLAAFGTKKVADVVRKQMGIQTKTERKRERYQIASRKEAKEQMGLYQQKDHKMATKGELEEYRNGLDQKLDRATKKESRILSAIRKASSYNAKAYQEAYERNTRYTYQNGYAYSKGRA